MLIFLALFCFPKVFLGIFSALPFEFPRKTKVKLFHYLVKKFFFFDWLNSNLTRWLMNVVRHSRLLFTVAYFSDKSLQVSLFSYSSCRFKLTTIKFAVIVNRAAQESIYRVYACHQTQRHNQLPQWDSTPNSRGRNRRESATVMASLLTHKGTVFHLVQLVATHRPAATPWSSNISQFQWPHQVSFRNFLRLFRRRELSESFLFPSQLILAPETNKKSFFRKHDKKILD